MASTTLIMTLTKHGGSVIFNIGNSLKKVIVIVIIIVILGFVIILR